MHPLIEAIHRGDIKAVRKCCAAHPEWLAGDHAFRPLHAAASRGDVAVLEVLLDAGADANAAGTFGAESAYNGILRPLHAAAGGGYAGAVEILLRHGADPTGGNRYMTPLLAAADAGHAAVVRRLVKAGCKADVFVASALGKVESVKTLLARDPTRARRRTEFGATALMVAAAHGHAEVAGLLLAAGADAAAHDARENHVLDYAAGIGHYDPANRGGPGHTRVAAALLAAGADVNSRNWRGVTPLHHAARMGRTGVAEVLLARGAAVNAKDVTGETPLRRAVINPDLDTVRLLIEHGADVNAKDKKGRRILAAARGAAMKALLKRHGAR